MNTRSTLLTIGFIGTISFSPPWSGLELRGQSPQESQQEKQATRAEDHGQAEWSLTSEFRGTNLVNPEGEVLGHVTDFAVTLESGELRYLLIADKTNAEAWKPVPPSAVDMRLEEGSFVLVVDVDLEEWADAQKVTEQAISGLANQALARDVDQFFGLGPDADQEQSEFGASSRQAGSKGTGIMVAGHAVGRHWQNQFGTQQGEVKDFLISVDDGRVGFALISSEDIPGTFAVAAANLEIVGVERIRLNVSEEDFRDPPELTTKYEPAGQVGLGHQRDPQLYRFQESH